MTRSNAGLSGPRAAYQQPDDLAFPQGDVHALEDDELIPVRFAESL